MVMILDVGVDIKLGSALTVNDEFDGVEQKANLSAPELDWLPPLEGLRPGKQGQYDGVDACPCNASGVAAL